MLHWRLGQGLAAFCCEIIFQSNSLWAVGRPHFPEWLSTLFGRKRGQAQKLIYQNYPKQNWPAEATDGASQLHTQNNHMSNLKPTKQCQLPTFGVGFLDCYVGLLGG